MTTLNICVYDVSGLKHSGEKSDEYLANQAVLNYNPLPKQAVAHHSWANEILIGGQWGGAKSHCLRMEAFLWCVRIPRLHVYLFRRTFSDLEATHILPALEQFPEEVCTYKDQKHRFEFNQNGSMLHMCHCQHDMDAWNYLSFEFNLLLMDEITSFTPWVINFLYSRNRCSTDLVPEKYRHKIPGFMASGSPGGPGHNFVKKRWIDFADPMEIKEVPPDPNIPVENQRQIFRQYIPMKFSENPYLQNQGYEQKMAQLPEPYRTAVMEGKWDIYLGQAFRFDGEHHVIKHRPVPAGAPIYMTFDWGYAAPYCVQWFWVDEDGRLFMFDELYGWNGTENQGLRLTDSEIAQKIHEREETFGFDKKRLENIIRVSDPSCFNKKPDYRGGGQGPSTAEEFHKLGIYLNPGDASRHLKIRQVHNRLRIYDDMAPMLQIYDNCVHTIRTIPILQSDENNMEDVDTKQEDHCYDALALVCMARPMGLETPKPKKPESRMSRHIQSVIDRRENERIENQFGMEV